MEDGSPSVSEGMEFAEARANDASAVDDGQSGFPHATKPALVFVAVSIACAFAAIASGSYALWLTRQKVARETISNVQDLLKICQDRMHQMEDDLNFLPSGMSPTG